MKITKIPGLGNYGHYIDDIDFDHLTLEEWLEIGKLHLGGLVTILRNVKITKDQYYERIQEFGPFKSSIRSILAKKYGKNFDAINPDSYKNIDMDPMDLKYIQNKKFLLEQTENGNYLVRISGAFTDSGVPLGAFSNGDVHWHSNESSLLTFAPLVALLGGTGMIGSSTGFVQTVNYYESLSESFKSELNEMILIHKYIPGHINDREKDSNFGDAINMRMAFCPIDGVETPLVATSPGGLTGLRYTVNTAVGIRGMTKKQSDKLFAKIDKELFKKENIFDHYYQANNDLLLFDNSVTLHRRLGGNLNRLAYRIQYDPSNLLDRPWYPFAHLPEFNNIYIEETRNLVKILGLTNYKLP